MPEQIQRSPALTAPPDLADRLARAFLVELEREIGEENFREVARRNQVDGDPAVCHSHDFCDANMVMASAWSSVSGLDVDVEDEGQRRAWNEAWALAKTRMPLLVDVPAARPEEKERGG